MTHFQGLFIQNLRFWRKKRGLSQQQLAEKINVSPNYLNAVENGKNFPSPEIIQLIADVLELMPFQLFLETPVEENLKDGALLADIVKNSDDSNVRKAAVEKLIERQQLVKELSDLIDKI